MSYVFLRDVTLYAFFFEKLLLGVNLPVSYFVL